MLPGVYKKILFCLILNLLFAATVFGLVDNWYHYEHGMKLLADKQYDGAIKEFNYYLHLAALHRHMFGVAYFGRGLVFEKRRNFDRAIIEYELAIKNDLHPTVLIGDKAYSNIGTIYMSRKNYIKAIGAYQKAVESNPQNGLAHYYLGLAYLRAGEIEKAGHEAESAKKLGIKFTALSEELDKIKNSANLTTDTEKANH